MAYTFEEAYKEIDEIYKRSGFGGIAEAADAGDEWAFIQNFNDGERLLGEHPLFFHNSIITSIALALYQGGNN